MALAAMDERSFYYYWARNYADLKRGEEYDQLNRTVAINILGFNLFDANDYPDMHSCFGIFDIKTGYQLTDKLEIHFLELPKFKGRNVKDMNRMKKGQLISPPALPTRNWQKLRPAKPQSKKQWKWKICSPKTK
ncbi:MAG: PD-(D/E)XK nuclease family transposase [Selenomonadaceae bacterium]|nr:PD-(D/E)XK nuclease family transposase [Selenomonadaceae bacterium]